MGDRSFLQYFGPSTRHPCACVEMSFPLRGDVAVAHLEDVLLGCGIRLGEDLPDGPLPLDEAVCRLARAMLARQAHWWTGHGCSEGRGWAALGHPMPRATVLALDLALDLVLAEDGISPAVAGKLRGVASALATMLKTRSRMLSAAQLLGLETAYVTAAGHSYQIGQGAKGMHFSEAGNERDSQSGSILEQNKQSTVATLRRMGLPTARGELASTPQQAAEAIARIGLPCVVKPVAMGRGAGVSTFLQSEAEAVEAFSHAHNLSRGPVLIERHVEGADHRLLVSGGELLWAYRRLPASVTGDGRATVGELIERENRRRVRIRSGSDAYLGPIDNDERLRSLLAGRYGLGLASVLEEGRRIAVVGPANTARGGLIEDVTGMVHPDNRALAIRAARLFRMHTLGVDLISPDISRSWKEVECAIIEVNRGPAATALGDTTLMVRTLFPNRLSGRIPVVAAIGGRDFLADAARTLGTAFAECGLQAAAADYPGPATPARHAVVQSPLAPTIENLMLDPDADAMLALCDPGEVEHRGFPLRRCDLLLVEDETHFGWLAGAAERVMAGKPSDAELAAAIEMLVGPYRDPAEGGPLPVLEPCAGDAGEFRVKVWRTRAMPRDWFWRQVGVAQLHTAGFSMDQDLLRAVSALAGEALRQAGDQELVGEFRHEEVEQAWYRITFEAAIEVPPEHEDEARRALLDAIDRVNAICVAEIPRGNEVPMALEAYAPFNPYSAARGHTNLL